MPDEQNDPLLQLVLEQGAAAAERLAKDAKGLDRAYQAGTLDAWVDAYEAREIKSDDGSDSGPADPSIPSASGPATPSAAPAAK